MGNVLTVQAKINGDASSLVAASKKAQAAMQETEKAAGKATTGMEKLGGSLSKSVGAGITGIGNLVTSVGKLGFAVAGLGTVAVGALTFKVAQAGLQRLEAIQDATVSLTRMLGSASAAADLTSKALAVVQGTPFAFPQFAEATRTLVAFGMQASKIPAVLTAVADSAAASGQGQAAVDGLVQAFAQLQVQGKLSSDIMQRFGTSGVNVLGILANAYNVSTADMQAMVSSGVVPAGKAIDILVSGIEKGSTGIAGNFHAIAGAAKDLGNTISGSIGNTKTAFARMGASWLKPFQKDLPDALNNGVIPLMDKLGAAGGRITQMFADTGVLTKFTKALTDMQKMVDPATSGFLRMVKSLSPLMIVWQALKDAGPELGRALSMVGMIVQQDLIPAFAKILETIVPLLPALTELISKLANGLVSILPGLTSMLGFLVTNVFVPFLTVLSNLPAPVLGLAVALVGLNKAGVPIGAIFDGIFSKIGNLRTQFNGLTSDVEGIGGKFATAGEGMGGFRGAVGGVASVMTGPLGLAIAGTVGAIAGLTYLTLPKAATNVDELAASFDRATGAMTKATDASVINALQQSGALDAARKFGLNLQDVVKASEGDVDASKRVADQMNKVQDAANKAADANNNLSGKANALRGSYNLVAQAIGGQVQAVKDAIAIQQNYLQATGASKAEQDKYKTSLDTFNASLATNGVNTDKASAAYKINVTALNTLGAVAKDFITTTQNQTHSTNATSAAQALMVSSLYNSARRMGMNSSEADTYTAKLLGIPKKVETDIRINAGNALANLDNLNAKINALRQQAAVGIPVMAPKGIKVPQANGGAWVNGVQAFANGGMRAFANGGVASGIYAARNPGIIKFAEPETHWETYISGKPGQESRNRELTLQTAKRLGMDLGGGGGNFRVVVSPKGGIDILKYIDVTVEQMDNDILRQTHGGSNL